MASKTATLDFQRVDFEPFGTQVGKVSWKSVLKGKEASGKTGQCFKKEVLEILEQAVLLCGK